MDALTAAELATAANDAATRIADIVRRTPLVKSAGFSRQSGTHTYLKLEHRQHTGSFKLRGAANRLLTLSNEQRSKGCVVASSGNHGAAVAYAMKALGVSGVIFVPEQTSKKKVEAIRSHGGDVRFFGTDGLDTEIHAREFAGQNDMFYLSPYNDPEVIAGQATCGVEIAKESSGVDAAFIAVGGGGLVSGVASVLKHHNPGVRIYGCQPLNSPVMARSLEAGEIIDMPSEPTLSDGTAGGIEAKAITFELCRSLVDEFVLVDEESIGRAMRDYMSFENEVIEGAAGVALAGLQQKSEELTGKNVVVVICGGNVSDETFNTVMNQ